MASITRRLAAVAFADVAGWSRLVEENELEALRAWNSLRKNLIEPKIREHAGRLVDLAGDAVLVEFASAVDAVHWAVELQRRPDPATDEPDPGPLPLRIGINVCDVLVDEGRLVGDGVNIAARIHQLASPGEIAVTEAVREHVQRRIAVSFHDLGERRLKNISRPIRVFRVEADGLPPPAPTDIGNAASARRTLLALDFPQARSAGDKADSATASTPREVPEYVVREVLRTGGGRVVGWLGTGLLIDFAETRPAIRTAFAIRQACIDANEGISEGRRTLPRMGVQQIGEALAEATGVPEGGASVATRLMAVAEPGQIVASTGVREGLIPALDADIEDLGECNVTAIGQPMRLYRLGPPVSHPAIEPPGSADELRPTIAVIPFMERGAGHESLGEILAEEVIAALSRSADLNVVSRLSTTVFRGRGATLDEVSSHLKASYVLSGAYRITSDAFTLAAELAETKSGRVVWARDLRGSVAGIVEGKDELIDRVVAESSRAVIARELERTQARSLESLDTCTLLIGSIALMHRLSLHDFERARDMLRVVAQRAPHHAVPHAWLAKWHVLRVWQGWSDNAAADTRLALDRTKNALDNDSHCSLALAIDGFVHTNLLKAFDVAQQRYDLALRLNPNDALAWSLQGMLHAFKGEGRQAVKSTQRGLRLSPLDPYRFFYEVLAGGAELAAGRYEQAIDLSQRSLRANRMHASTFRVLAISQWQLGRHDDARATVAALMKIEPTLTVSQWLERSPSSDYPIGKLCAGALRNAGVPP